MYLTWGGLLEIFNKQEWRETAKAVGIGEMKVIGEFLLTSFSELEPMLSIAIGLLGALPVLPAIPCW